MPAPDAIPTPLSRADEDSFAELGNLRPTRDLADIDNGPIDIRPVKGNVIVEIMQIPPRIGSIHVPEVAQRDLKRGRVVAVGDGTVYENGERIPPDVKIGDVVLYGAKWQGEEFERAGRRFRVLEPEQTMAVIPAIAAEDGAHLERIQDAWY